MSISCIPNRNQFGAETCSSGLPGLRFSIAKPRPSRRNPSQCSKPPHPLKGVSYTTGTPHPISTVSRYRATAAFHLNFSVIACCSACAAAGSP